jgi:hypothetical protein
MPLYRYTHTNKNADQYRPHVYRLYIHTELYIKNQLRHTYNFTSSAQSEQKFGIRNVGGKFETASTFW